MLQVQQGDQAAFAQLYNRYVQPLTGFAAARLASLEEARDIIHDLFVQLWQVREQIAVTVSLRAYLFAAVRYRIIDHLRKNSNQRIYAAQLAQLPESVSYTEDVLHARELEQRLQQAVSELSPRVQEVFKLSRFEHLKTAEIAQKLGVSEQTVKNQLTTALSYLRARLSSLSVLLLLL